MGDRDLFQRHVLWVPKILHPDPRSAKSCFCTAQLSDKPRYGITGRSRPYYAGYVFDAALRVTVSLRKCMNLYVAQTQSAHQEVAVGCCRVHVRWE